MTSKNLFFKLMKEDLKSRMWVAALVILGFFFQFPVTAAYLAGDIENAATYEKGLAEFAEAMKFWMSFGNGMTVFVMTVLALICGLSGFSYLNSRSKVDFYHSIPVRREKLFLANYLNGILIPAVPFAICLAAAAVISVANGVDGAELGVIVLEGYVLHLVYYTLTYTVVVIAAMLTGHVVIGFLGSLVLWFYVPLAVMLINAHFAIHFKTFMENTLHGLMKGIQISPVVEYVTRSGEYANQMEPAFGGAAAALAISAVLAVAACMLYRRRPSEAAGKAMAFRISCPIIRILIVLMCAQYLGEFFWGIRESMAWVVFGVVMGGLISHCVIEVIYNFDFKKLFSHSIQLVGCIVVSLAVIFTFRYDLFGFDSYLPEKSQVKEAAVFVSRLNGWVSYGEPELREEGGYRWSYGSDIDYVFQNMKCQDMDHVLEIAAAGIADLDRDEEELEQAITEVTVTADEYGLSDSDISMEYNADGTAVSVIGGADGPTSIFVAGKVAPEEEIYSRVQICYTLNSGRKVYRSYHMRLNSAWGAMAALYNDSQYQLGAYPLMSRTGEDVAAVRYRELQDETNLSELSAEQRAELLSTYQHEFAALTMDQMKQELPIGLIRFVTAKGETAIRWYEEQEREGRSRYYYDDSIMTEDYYPLYPSFTRTIKLLKAYGLDPGKGFEKLDIRSVEIYHYSQKYEEGRNIVITDPQEIEKLKKSLVNMRITHYDQLYAMDDFDVSIGLADKQKPSINVGFPKGEVPEFVMERLDQSMKD